MKGNELVNEPFDFSTKNRLNLADLHTILKTVIFPASTAKEKRFNLTKEDCAFLYKYMSMYPRESAYPYYDSTVWYDTYVKFLLYGSEPVKTEPHIRIFNKVGDAYGFLIDAAYIVDYKNNVEFILSAAIQCNSDGIFNDDKYDYDTIGFPFLKNLGRVIYEHELKRKRTIVPDLSSFEPRLSPRRREATRVRRSNRPSLVTPKPMPRPCGIELRRLRRADSAVPGGVKKPESRLGGLQPGVYREPDISSQTAAKGIAAKELYS